VVGDIWRQRMRIAQMNTLPLQLKLGTALLVGRGEAAKAKHRLLEDMGAQIIWWQHAPSRDMLKRLAKEQERPNTRLALVVIAGFSSWCEELAEWAQAQRLLLNWVDNPEESNVFFPAIIKRGKLRIGIGSGGINPVLARLIRERIENALPQQLTQLVALVDRWRKYARALLPDFHQRRLFWESLLFGSTADQLCSPRANESRQDILVRERLEQVSRGGRPPGMVSLVSAGPGGAGLLTRDAQRLLASADVVFHDTLVAPEVLALTRRDAQVEAVGRRSGEQMLSIQEICARMIHMVEKGKQVCRLQGGDALLFGRSGEEIAMLKQAGVPWRIIPGVTSASAAAADLGLPLTQRGVSQGLSFITGHQALESMARRQGETLVVYMGYGKLASIADKLLSQGESPYLPLALVQNAGLPQQVNRIASLARAWELAGSFDLTKGPVLVIIGEIAAYAHSSATNHALNAIRISNDLSNLTKETTNAL